MVFHKGEVMTMSSAKTGVASVVKTGVMEGIDASAQEKLDREYPPNVRDVVLTGPNTVGHDGRRTEFWIGWLSRGDRYETIGLMDEAQRLGLKELGIGHLVRRIVEAMLAQWGQDPEAEPPAMNMWECALAASHTFVLKDPALRRSVFLPTIVCQGGREKTPAGLIRAIMPSRSSRVATLQSVIDELQAYGCSSEEIALAWKRMLNLRFALGFKTPSIFEWWVGLKFGGDLTGAQVAEEVNRLCVIRDLRKLTGGNPVDATPTDSMEFSIVGAGFLDMVEKICSSCDGGWRQRTPVIENVEQMIVRCLSHGNVTQAFQMFVRFGSYFGLYNRDPSGNINKDLVVSAFKELIRKAIKNASDSHQFGTAAALAELVSNVRDIVLVSNLRTLAKRNNQRVAVNPFFYVWDDTTTECNL